MAKKCGFCKAELSDERSFEVCNNCGVGIWGEKMFQTILENMQNAKHSGNFSLID